MYGIGTHTLAINPLYIHTFGQSQCQYRKNNWDKSKIGKYWRKTKHFCPLLSLPSKADYIFAAIFWCLWANLAPKPKNFPLNLTPSQENWPESFFIEFALKSAKNVGRLKSHIAPGESAQQWRWAKQQTFPCRPCQLPIAHGSGNGNGISLIWIICFQLHEQNAPSRNVEPVSLVSFWIFKF